jgi:hypothetical protein
MYLACRHIKPNGVRCQSPALSGHAFCYYHARAHSTTRSGKSDKFALPVPGDHTTIQESLGRIFEAIVSDRVNSKKAAQLLWGLQIAVQTIPRKPQKDPRSVESITLTEDGTELAPVLNVCQPGTDCKKCDKARHCPARFDFNQVLARKNDDDNNHPSIAELLERAYGDPEDASNRDPGEDSGDGSNDEDPDQDQYADSPDWDDDDDKEDDPGQPLKTLQALRELAEALEIGKDG